MARHQNMIEQTHINQRQRLPQLAGELNIRLAGLGAAGGVIVGDAAALRASASRATSRGYTRLSVSEP